MAIGIEGQQAQTSPADWIEAFRNFDPEANGRIILPENLPPIPPLGEPAANQWSSLAWKRVPIDDKNPSHHMAVASARDHLLCDPIYYRQERAGAYPEIYVRYIVLGIMMAIDKVLKKRGLQVLAWDGWRSAETQLALFTEQKGVLQSANPTKIESALILETQKYVSIPTAHPFHPSPHMTGGAIDWTIADMDGKPLNMGGEFDDFSEVSRTRYFEALTRPLSPEETIARENRRIHYWVSRNMGMANYPEEWWHSSFGDQMWAMDSNAPSAIFGPAPMASVDQLVDSRKVIKVNLPGLRGEYIIQYPHAQQVRDGIRIGTMEPDTAIWAVHEVNMAVRALHEADQALGGIRELTQQEMLNTIQRVVKQEVQFEAAA